MKASRREAPDGPRIVYVPLPGVTEESELHALSAVYSFLVERHENRKVANASGKERGGDDCQPATVGPTWASGLRFITVVVRTNI